jgi:hypothetical protein
VRDGASLDTELALSVTVRSRDILAHHRIGVPRNDVKSTLPPLAATLAATLAIAVTAFAYALALAANDPPRDSASISDDARASAR